MYPTHTVPLVKPILIKISYYIAIMAGKYTDYDNVVDFIEYRIRRLIAEFTKRQRFDIVKVLSQALEEYNRGEYDIVFKDGWPNIVKNTDEPH